MEIDRRPEIVPLRECKVGQYCTDVPRLESGTTHFCVALRLLEGGLLRPPRFEVAEFKLELWKNALGTVLRLWRRVG